MKQLRRVFLVGLDDPGLRSRGLQVEEVTVSALRAAIASSSQGAVAVLGRAVLDAGNDRDLSWVLHDPLCIPFACPDGAAGLNVARWARESGWEFVDRVALPARVATAARVPIREVVPIAQWAPAKARCSTEMLPALGTLSRCHPLTAAEWARSLELSRFQLYRLCMRSSRHSADRLTWLCLKATVAGLEAIGHDPSGVHVLVGYSSDYSLRRALRRKWR